MVGAPTSCRSHRRIDGIPVFLCPQGCPMRTLDFPEVVNLHCALTIAIHRKNMAVRIQQLDAIWTAFEDASAQFGELERAAA